MSNNAHASEAVPSIPEEVQPDYQLLVGHRRTDGSFKTTEELQSQYIYLTDRLIRQMTDGVEVSDPVTGERETSVPDYVIWLDKSARPVSWLTKELWPRLAPNPGSEDKVPEMPKFGYVNIDREQWINTVDPQGTGHMDIDLVDDSIIRSLRSVFIEPKDKRSGLTEELDNRPAELDGKTILIVDEVMSSGRTLDIADKFFQRAFPSAKIAVTHWMGGITQRGVGSFGNADLPVWYKEKTETGRGIANRDERISQKSVSLTQRLGAYFLSTRFPEVDQDSLQLRRELRNLAHDPNVLVEPSRQREDYEERALALNGLGSIAEFVERKRTLQNSKS